MSEYVRRIEITVRIDTNKRTDVVAILADSLDDALNQVRDHLNDVRWSV